jgi:hypothetical protein
VLDTRTSRLLAGGTAVLLTATVSTLPASAASGERPEAAFSLDGGSAQVAVAGTITRSGDPVDAEILLVAWPEAAVLDKLAVGEVVPMTTLAVGQTAPNGDYSIPLDFDSVPADYIDDSGQVDVDLRVADATSEVQWSISLVKESAVGSWATAADDTGAVPSISVDLDSGHVKDSSLEVDTMVDAEFEPVPADAAVAQTTASVEDRTASFDRQAAAHGLRAATQLDPICDTVRSGTTHVELESWALSQGTTNVEVTGKQSNSLTHTMGVAVKGSSGWKMSGTLAKTTTAGGVDGPYKGAYYLTNKVRYRDYKNSCTGNTNSSRPEALTDIFSTKRTATRKNWTTCESKSSGTYTKETERNATISGAIDLHGTELTAQAGWSSKATLDFKFTGPARICGSNGEPWVDAPQVVARPR